MGKRYQITTFDGQASQFSRVADRSILAGIDRKALGDHLAHLDAEEYRTVIGRLDGKRARSFYLDRRGNYALVQVHS